MNSDTKKLKLITISIFLLIFAVVASACGSTESIPLIGVGGSNSQDDATATPAAEEPIVEPPTPTPIPEPFGRIIFVSNREGQKNLFITAPNGTDLNRLTANGSEDSTPRISPDGTKIAFVSTVNNNMDIYILDLGSGAITRITDAPEKDASPSWSPDGTRLAFESFRDGNFEIYVTNIDGSNQIRITNDSAGDSHPVWSPVGNEIAFVSNRYGNADILLTSLNGSISTLTTNVAPDSAPTWSPDGSRIAFQTHDGELSHLCIIGRDGLGQNCVTSAMAKYSPPAWSPDGNWIAASTPDSGIHLFNLADNSMTQLSAPGIEPLGIPSWSPDGLRLVLQAQTGGSTELFMTLIQTNEFTQLTFTNSYNGEPHWFNN